MFNKNINHEKPKNVIATGVKMNDRLNFFKNKGLMMNAIENHMKGVPKKLILPSELTKKLANTFDTNKNEESNMENGTKTDKNKDNNNKNNENKEIETTKGTEHIQMEENKRDEEQNNNNNQENKNEAKNQEINEENNKKAEDFEKENEKNEDNIEENKKSLKEEQQNNIEENEHREKDVEEEHLKNEKENIEEDNEEIAKEELNQELKTNDEQRKGQSPQNEETEEKKEEEEKEVKEEEKEVKEEEKEVKEEEKELKEEEKVEEKEGKIEGIIQEEKNQQIEGEQIEGEKKKIIEDEQEKDKEEIIKKKEIPQDEVQSDTKNQEENELHNRDSVLRIDNETKDQQLKEKDEGKKGENEENNTENECIEKKDEYLSLKKGKSIEEILGVQNINEKQKNQKELEDYLNKQQRTSNIKRSFCFKEEKKFKNKSDLKEDNDTEYLKFQGSFSMNLLKAGTVCLEQEMKLFNEKQKEDKRKNSFSKKRNTLDDFEIVEDDYLFSEDCQTIFLESINYDNYLSDLKSQGIEESPRETFCEGFFIASFPKKEGKVIEKSENLPAQCGHEECSRLPSMKPEIIMRYPLKDTKNLELNNLAATICFPTGIKLCYSEKPYPKKFEGYVTQITNTKGERYYMRTFHFYHKMLNMNLDKEYDLNPLKHKLKIFADNYLVLNEDEYTDDITNNIQENLKFCEELGFREDVYVPYCICLISKYSYTKELEICLDTIFKIMAHKPNELNFEINELIMYLIHSVPIPLKNMRVRFYIPFNNTKLELLCPKIDDVSTMNSKLTSLFDYLSVDNIILVFRLLLSEKKILFIHDDYIE